MLEPASMLVGNMWGTFVNVVAIIAGVTVGILLRAGIPERVKEVVMQGIGLAVIYIGITMALNSEHILIVLISLVIGAIIGGSLRIEDSLNRLGDMISNKVGKDKGSVSEAFVVSTLVYCVGAMAIMGALESGLTGEHNILYVKSVLDGTTAIAFASSMGIGVIFSTVPVFDLSGGLSLYLQLRSEFT